MSGRAAQRQDLAHLTDEQWHQLLVRSVAGPVDGLSLPGFPAADVQTRFVGATNAGALHGAFEFYKLTKQKVTLQPTSRVLDFGIGWGRILRYFMKDVESGGLYGVDPDEFALEQCRKSEIPANLEKIDRRGSLPHPDAFFDLVYAYSVFTHLPEAVQNIWLSEIARVLKPGGIFIATVEPPRFLDFVFTIAADTPHLWYQRLRASVQAAHDPRGEFERRGFLFLPLPEEIGRDSTYGNSITSESYVRQYWASHFVVHEYIDDKDRFFQAVVVCEKEPPQPARDKLAAPIHHHEAPMTKANPKVLNWVNDKLIDFGDWQVELAIGKDLFERQSTEKSFVLGKGRTMIDALVAELGDRDVRRMVDVGIFKGGSIILFDQLFSPDKLIAIELKKPNLPGLAKYIEARGSDRIRAYTGVNQADQKAIAEICRNELGGAPLDLVVDDASHFHHETRETFRALFPRLRAKGLYVIEDWGWAHWTSELWKTPHFQGKRPLSHFLIELSIMCASSPGAIPKISLNANQIFITRGWQPLEPGFDPASLCLNRGASLFGEGSGAPQYR